MAKKNLQLIITAGQAYMKSLDGDDDSSVNEILFNAISNTYIPLLNLFRKFEDEMLPFKIGMVLSAPLCSLLEDTDVQNQYVKYLERKIALGEKELVRLAGDEKKLALARKYLHKAEQDKNDFVEIYKCRLVPEFKRFADNKHLELIATAATSAFLPHYSNMHEILNAQVEVGLSAHKHFFGDSSDGFYLPYLGWTDNVDKVLKSYGVGYSIVDTPALLFAENAPERGIFEPVRSSNSLPVFARDNYTDEEFNGEDGYVSNEVYRNEMRDIGFDLDYSQLSDFVKENGKRVQTGFKYFAGDEGEDVYNVDAALEQVKADARDFYEDKCQKLLKAEELNDGRDVSLVCTIPASLMGQSWFEGVEFLEQVVRLVLSENKISLGLCRDVMETAPVLPKVSLYACAGNGTGYGEDLLDSKNCWMLRYIYKACERMVDLTGRFPSDTGLKARLLNLASREILLAMSGELPEMIHDDQNPDLAEKYFKDCILSFTSVFDSLGSNSVSTEWLTSVEKKHALFPWINYRVFSRKK